MTDEKTVVIIGAGPAGLTAAYELVKQGCCPVVLERDRLVGGLARTEKFKGFHFDIGGHRFFTKVDSVRKMWQEVLGEDFRRRPRLSRIYYKNRFFSYPLKPLNALRGLGIFASVLIVLSYVKWRIFPYPREDTFEQWVTNRFGKRLFETFFKTYTEKVWGISCSELKAEWAAQRIKGLSLKTVLLSVLITPKNTIKSLIEEFDYPTLGPGMMWNTVKERVERRGGGVRLNTEVVRVNRQGNRIQSVTVRSNGVEEVIPGTHFISSMPITDWIARLAPPAPEEVRAAARRLTYRDFITVGVIVNRPHLFPDNWIYVHSPEVQVGRIQNFKNWSPDMVPDPAKTSLGLEYFCREGDALWRMPDEALIDLARRELEWLGLAKACDVEDGVVIRQSKAYPVYDSDYAEYLAVVREYVGGLENFQTIGRNGLHRYNNQDHAMLTGMLAVRNLVLGQRNDLWRVNAEAEYHEEARVEEGVEEQRAAQVLDAVVPQVFMKLDRTALGVALGTTCGALLCVATLWLVLKGGPVVGPRLQLLSQYFPGYRVTAVGSLIGLAYGFLTGYVGGWLLALLRNTGLFLYMAGIRRRAERVVLRNFLDYV